MKQTRYTALLLALTVVVSATAVVGAAGSAISTQTQTETNTITSCTTITESGTYVLGKDITANRSGCIRIEASNVVLDGNGHTIDGNEQEFVQTIVASAPNQLSNVTVRNLTVRSVQDFAIRYEHVTSGAVTNVSFSKTDGIILRNSSDISITQNSFPVMKGIRLDESDNNRIAHNTFGPSEYGSGIRMTDSDGNTITENVAKSISGGLIYAMDSNRNRVTDNTVTDAAGGGIDFGGGDNNFAARNTLQGNADINVAGTNSTVVNNTASGGITVHGTNNRILHNEAENGKYDIYGIKVYGSGHTIVENTASGIEQDGADGAAISIQGRNHTVARNNLTGDSGIVVQSANEEITIRNNRIEYTVNGVHINDPELCGVAGAKAVEIHQNTLVHPHGNMFADKSYGVLNEGNATHNYWGNATGPSSSESVNGTLEDPVTGTPANGEGVAVSEGTNPGVSNVHFFPYLSAPPQDENENATA